MGKKVNKILNDQNDQNINEFSDKEKIIPSNPKEVNNVAVKVKLFNTMKQLQQIHIVRNGKDTVVPIMGRRMVTITSDEMTGDVRMRITKGLLQKK